MSGISILMLVLLVHMGGVELDSAREAAVDLFAAGTPVGRWELSDRGGGHYQFVGADDLLRVERLAHPDLTYAVVHGRSATDVLGVGTVSLLPYGEALRVGGTDDSLDVPAAEALVAWSRSPARTDGGSMDEIGDGEDGARMDATSRDAVRDRGNPDGAVSDLVGSLIVTSARGQMSVGHPESGHVMVLRYTP